MKNSAENGLQGSKSGSWGFIRRLIAVFQCREVEEFRMLVDEKKNRT